jgi:hypothetical protein
VCWSEPNLERGQTQARDSLLRESSSGGRQLWAQGKRGEVETWQGIDGGVGHPEKDMHVCGRSLHECACVARCPVSSVVLLRAVASCVLMGVRPWREPHPGGTHSVEVGSFGHRGREVQGRPSWALMGMKSS